MSTLVNSSRLLEKSIQAALSAIEIYNKPDFRYREEAFAILMCNSFELLLKAKSVADNGDDFSTIVAMRPHRDETTGEARSVPKLNRSGNVMTVGLLFLAAGMYEQKVEGFSRECITNIELLVEVRDNSIHLVSDDLTLSKTILEIGTASLKNYMDLASKWFGVDFSRYNFFLMPLSFFHGFTSSEFLPTGPKTEQAKRFLEFLSTVEKDVEEGSPHFVTLSIETKVVKARGNDGIAVRWTSDESAPALRVREENILERYPYDSADLARKIRERYSDFKQDRRYYKLKGPLEGDEKYCRVRYLDPKNPRSGSKKFFSTEVFKVFDLHYNKRKGDR